MATRIRIWILAAAAAVLAITAAAMFRVETNSIRVLAPENYRGHHKGAIANFGVPKYGGSLTGVVTYPDRGTNGCDPFDGPPFRSRSKRPVILLLDRGDCFFALKAWNGQKAGAAAVLVADYIDERLLTMDSPEDSRAAADYAEKITIPSAFVKKELGDSLKEALKNGSEEVVVKLDWRKSMPHPDERVEYELWTNSNDECGSRCDEQINFVKNFKGHAQILERGGYTMFTPHYITWYCPEVFTMSHQCTSQCINRGRYCVPDPERDLREGYDGKDVVIENLRQLCVHRVANQTSRSWVWWDFVTDFHIRCSMKEKKYSKECAENVIKSLGLPLEKVKECMGDPDADVENEVLKNEQERQVGHGARGDVAILPTLVINNVQYRGVLERGAVLKAICAGFKETTEPSVCLSEDMETNECLENNGGCWIDKNLNVTACKDTFRGRVCKCPTVNGVVYDGDGYFSCTAVGPGRCAANKGGCWSETRDGVEFSACSELQLRGCYCPTGFHGDGDKCEDIDECADKLKCQCDGCTCKNTWGSYDCKCKGNQLYIQGEDTCITRGSSRFGWVMSILVLSCMAGAGVAGYIFYKYRLRSYMDSEVMSIMSQYMPLDNHHNEAQPLRQDTKLDKEFHM